MNPLDSISVGDLTPSELEHVLVLVEAFNIIRDRQSEREEIWRESGIKGQAFHCYAKAERAFRQAQAGQVPNKDHFLDLINYATFAVRLGDDLEGSWPW